MSVIRWTLTDPISSDTTTLFLNPNKMDGVDTARSMTWAWGSRWGSDRMRGIDLPPGQPSTWTFGGVIIAKDHYDQLLLWTKRLQSLLLEDHLGRTFKIIIQQFDPVERLPTAILPWRADYTMSCLLLEDVS